MPRTDPEARREYQRAWRARYREALAARQPRSTPAAAPPRSAPPSTRVVGLCWIRAGAGRVPVLAAVVRPPSTWDTLEHWFGPLDEAPRPTPAPEPAIMRALGVDHAGLLSAMAVPWRGGAR